MDATTEDTKPLRRVGRPRKVVEGDDDFAPVSIPAGRAMLDVESVEPMYGPVVSVNPAQAYAERVWAGQSSDVPPHERLERVRAALEGQNLDCAGVTLDGHKL